MMFYTFKKNELSFYLKRTLVLSKTCARFG